MPGQNARKVALLLLMHVLFTSPGLAQIEIVKTVEGGEIENLFPYDGQVFFTIGDELWRTNDPSAPIFVSTIPPPSGKIGYFATDKYLLLAIPLTTSDDNFELWSTDGTANGTIKLSSLSSPIWSLSGSESKYFFATNGELWKTNFLPGGTERILGAALLTSFVIHESKAFVVKNDSVLVYDEYSGTFSTVMPKIGTSSSFRLRRLFSTGENLYASYEFCCCCEPSTTIYRISTDGGEYSSAPLPSDVIRAATILTFKDYLITSSYPSGIQGDPPVATRSIRNSEENWQLLGSGYTQNFHVFADFLYWGFPFTIYRSDGSAAGTTRMDFAVEGMGITEGWSVDPNIHDLAVTDRFLFFTANSNLNHLYLFAASDGVSKGIYRFKTPVKQSGRLHSINDNDVYIIDGDDAVNNEILYYRGGMTQVVSLSPHLESHGVADIQGVIRLGDKLFFAANAKKELVSYNMKDVILAVKDEEPQPIIKVFPNPARAEYVLEAPEPGRVTIFHSSGQRLSIYDINRGRNIMDASELPAGHYIMLYVPHEGPHAPSYSCLVIAR